MANCAVEPLHVSPMEVGIHDEIPGRGIESARTYTDSRKFCRNDVRIMYFLGAFENRSESYDESPLVISKGVGLERSEWRRLRNLGFGPRFLAAFEMTETKAPRATAASSNS